ncbi:MAG TPA: hypothetical protein VKG23_00650 [Thermoanaerobaculia bacterium]|nr:hypothetical protein [Thermoanaerobaculia bacterium]
MRRLIFATALSLGAALARAQGPSADWRTFETVHFRVHFPAPFEPWARHAASELEAIHARVTEFVGYVPPERIEVVVSDPLADANGAAVPFLDRPEIHLWTTPPESESSIGEYGDWMEDVATHETAHIAHLTPPFSGALAVLARLSPAPFGPLALRTPRWAMEGYATLVEGALTDSGRPRSVFRAMVLRQLGIEGKLPDYSDLDSADTWLGGSVAYLVGSAYLEWLAEREGAAALPRLWKAMTSLDGGGFDSAFRSVFGESPETLYDRFRAETSARAIEEEKRLKADGLVGGELELRLRGGTLGLAVSPDGGRLLARRDPSRHETFLAIWSVGPSITGRPRWSLPRSDGYSASDPRWMPDGRAVLFARRAPDADGVLRCDLHRWDYEAGRVRTITRGADASDADPEPGGKWAVAVKSRFGATSLQRVDLASGRVSEIPVTLPVAEAWPVWSHPRVSPDGRRIAALVHAGRRWRLVTLAAEGGAASEIALDSPPVSAPAWSADGVRLYVASAVGGIWNVVAADPADGSAPPVLTRVTGGAFAPAPAPDGRSLYFLDFGARGVSVRKLSPGSAVPAAGGSPVEDARAVLPPRSGEAKAFAAATVSPSAPYDVWGTQAVRPLLGFSFGPSGNTVQAGADSADVLGRLHLMAVGSAGNAVGPRGGTIAAAYRGFPVALTAQLFSAIEKPGNQDLAPRPAFDEQRWGGYLDGAWTRPWSWGRLELDAGGGGSRVEAFATGDVFTRVLGSASAKLVYRRTRGRSGFGADAAVAGSLGATAGQGWRQWSAGGALVGILPFLSASASARTGDTGGSPSLFDVFAIGGAPSAILPPGLDANRIASPALPADLQTGERFEAYRAEMVGAAIPLAVYAEWMRAWSTGAPRPDPVRVVGAEVRFERLIPAEYGRDVTFHVGVGWISSDLPRIHTARGYAQLVVRP